MGLFDSLDLGNTLIGLIGLVLIVMVARLPGRIRAREADGGTGDGSSPAADPPRAAGEGPSAAFGAASGAVPGAAHGAELVAVIAAAISAVNDAVGMEGGAFRIASIEAVGGFNTPVWGHADRISRSPQSR